MPILNGRIVVLPSGKKIFFITGEDGKERVIPAPPSDLQVALDSLTPEERELWETRRRFNGIISWPDPIEKGR